MLVREDPANHASSRSYVILCPSVGALLSFRVTDVVETCLDPPTDDLERTINAEVCAIFYASVSELRSFRFAEVFSTRGRWPAIDVASARGCWYARTL